MAKVKGFKGIRYNKNKIENISDVIAPPYDVINQEQQELLYSMHDKNIIKIDLNKTEGDAKYVEASKLLNEWINNEILIQEDKESIYRSEERRVGKECRSRWSPYH